jgi:hypothetical protein
MQDRSKSNRNGPKLCRFELSGTNRINSKLHRIEVRHTDLVKQELKRKKMITGIEANLTFSVHNFAGIEVKRITFRRRSEKKTYLVQNLSGMT